ncbi:MAG: hypothetical protein MMC33_004049 [Icmadophila ericetorum]|nr:hypothetical protein [Icmadophila ericetorum]
MRETPSLQGKEEQGTADCLDESEDMSAGCRHCSTGAGPIAAAGNLTAELLVEIVVPSTPTTEKENNLPLGGQGKQRE